MSLDEKRLMKYLEDKFSAIDDRFDAMDEYLKGVIDSLRNGVDGLYERTETLEAESAATTLHLRRIDDTLKRHRLHP